MVKDLKINFCNFWKGFDPNNYFGFLLDDYRFVASDLPDFVMYSCFRVDGTIGFDEIRSDAVRIFFTGENVRPDMTRCDWAFSFCREDDISSERHFRLPNYALRLWRSNIPSECLLEKKSPEVIYKSKSKFCNFVYSNPQCEIRNEFFHLLSKYKKVDSAGRLFNNVGSILPGASDGVIQKLKFLKDYKFTIAFENSSSPGYITEKLVEAILADTVPIYWGDPGVCRDFNTKRFISFFDNELSLDRLARRVIEVDGSPDLYMDYLAQPFLNDSKLTVYFDKQRAIECFRKIFD